MAPKLCKTCKDIPFNACVSSPYPVSPDTTTARPPWHCIKLRKILKHKDTCTFCALLFRSSCQPENDLFKYDHILDHLHDSKHLKDIKTFAIWAEQRPSRLVDLIKNDDAWPFGYTRDQSEATEVKNKAIDLFKLAEKKDLNMGSSSWSDKQPVETGIEAAYLFQATAFGTGIASIAHNDRLIASTHLVTSQLAMASIRKPKRLPCWYIIGAYSKDETKAGVLSVRVYAHGRGARALLKEISHFSLRFESADPRIHKQQIWYGRILQPTVEVEFFKFCLNTCQDHHGEPCNIFRWRPKSSAPPVHQSSAFRLIDVDDMCLVEKSFEDITEGTNHAPYVALSYVWGLSLPHGWTEYATTQDSPAELADFYYYNSTTRESTYHHPSRHNRKCHVRLMRRNLRALVTPQELLRRQEDIPLTIQDAIKVVKRIGQRYLWVDSLCIIQDEEDVDNKDNIDRMDRIYGEALLTIVAADSWSADAGIKGISSTRNISKQICASGIAGTAQVFLPISISQNFQPWESRAWTFQEKMLSRRLLLFAGGFATWYCKGGVWREDVNARDVGTEVGSLQRLYLESVEPDREPAKSLGPKKMEHDDSIRLKSLGLTKMEHDDSFRLFRTGLFDQYTRSVEDFSQRLITDSWKILDAFKGLQNVFGNTLMMNCEFQYGVPLAYMDSALLWQPRRWMRRREGNASQEPPPAWSWAGWESVREGSQVHGVYYEPPFEVRADDAGIFMRLKENGEERMRPRKQSVYAAQQFRTKSGITIKLKDVGLFGNKAPVEQDQALTDYKDWESRTGCYSTPSLPVAGAERHQISNRNLVLRTEVASLTLGATFARVRTYTKAGPSTYFRELDWNVKSHPCLAKEDSDTSISQERPIVNLSSANRDEWVGAVKMTHIDELEQQEISVEAIVLSEAQYLGNEKNFDVLGYPLYNIMVIKRTQNGVAERIGLGKVRKSAWRKADPVEKVILLG